MDVLAVIFAQEVAQLVAAGTLSYGVGEQLVGAVLMRWQEVTPR